MQREERGAYTKKRVKKVRYLLAVSRGIIRAVFEPDAWRSIDNDDKKQFFGKCFPHHMSADSQNPIRNLDVE